MEKYGVDTIKVPVSCPLCGKVPERDGAVLRCPTHGSKPFEMTSTHGVESMGSGEEHTE